MSNRLRSDLWVAAFIKKVQIQGGSAYLEHKGEAQAGAIFIKIENLALRTVSLYAPVSSQEADERHFMPVLIGGSLETLEARLNRELQRDRDIWIISVESQRGDIFLEKSEIIL